MPSLRMKRSTRVFVPKKDGEGVRVLRSGRRVRVESGVSKIGVSVEGKGGDDLYRLIERSDEEDKVGKGSELGDAGLHEIDEEAEPQFPCLNKSFGIVYGRKRKMFDLKWKNSNSDRKFGLHFIRKQRRRIVDDGCLYLSVSNSSNGGISCGFAGVLSSVLRYMWTCMVGLVELSQSQLLDNVLASCGIHFTLKWPCNRRYAFCKIYGAREFIPLFDIDFASVPLCFVQLHTSMWFRSMRLSLLLLTTKSDQQEEDDSDDDAMYVSCQSSFPGHVIREVEDSRILHTPYVVARSTGSALPHRIGLTTRGSVSTASRNGVVTTRGSRRSSVTTASRNGVVTTRGSRRSSVTTASRSGVVTRSCSRNGVATRGCYKRRKRSPRTRRARNLSLFGVYRGCESSVLDFGVRESAVESASAVHNYEDCKLVRSNSSTGDTKLLKSSLFALGEDMKTVSCSANLLVVESDRCYRESGACVTLELSTANEWLLVVRIDGSLRCSHRAEKEKEVKPHSTNRYTCAIVWCVEPEWKLEFTERKDWGIFKELFRVCGDRNIVSPCPTKAIPIPGVCEVSGAHFSDVASYCRPELFIKLKDDELSRVLLKKTANYDMDSDDEEWLTTFCSRMEDANRVTEDSFEMMIDSFEKASFCSQHDFTDDTPGNLYLDLEREVVEAVYSYWTKKRKQKGTPLLRVFQLNKSKTPFIVKPVLRKKRSMKQRHTAKTTSVGRGKQLCVLQGMAAEENDIEEKSSMVDVEEAREVAKSAMEAALEKRRRAQILMESADLAMYRAAIAVRIAEAAQVADPDRVVTHFVDVEKDEGQTDEQVVVPLC